MAFLPTVVMRPLSLAQEIDASGSWGRRVATLFLGILPVATLRNYRVLTPQAGGISKGEFWKRGSHMLLIKGAATTDQGHCQRPRRA